MEIGPDVARRGAGLGVEWMVRDACEVSALDAAGLATADVVVAATGDDEDNLVVSLLAKQEFAVPRVVARVNHPKNHWLFNQTWGVDIAVSTPHLLAALVEEAVSVGSLVRILQLESSGAHLVEVTLAPGSPAAGRELALLGMPRDATVVAVGAPCPRRCPSRRHGARSRRRGPGAGVARFGRCRAVPARGREPATVQRLVGQRASGLRSVLPAPPPTGEPPGTLRRTATPPAEPFSGRRLRPGWTGPVYGSVLAVSTAVALSALMVPLRATSTWPRGAGPGRARRGRCRRGWFRRRAGRHRLLLPRLRLRLPAPLLHPLCRPGRRLGGSRRLCGGDGPRGPGRGGGKPGQSRVGAERQGGTRLLDLSEMLVRELPAPKLLDTIVSSVKSGFNLEGVALLLPGADGGLEVVASAGVPLSELDNATALRPGAEHCHPGPGGGGRAAATSRPLPW